MCHDTQRVMAQIFSPPGLMRSPLNHSLPISLVLISLVALSGCKDKPAEEQAPTPTSSVPDTTDTTDTTDTPAAPSAPAASTPTQTAPAAATEPLGLESGTWTLDKIKRGDTVTSPGAQHPANLVFKQDKVSGKLGCNTLFGSYVVAQGKIDMSKIAATKMACPGEGAQQEQVILKVLNTMTSYSIDGQTLKIVAAPDHELHFTNTK